MRIYSTKGVGELLGHLSERQYDREFKLVNILGKHGMKSGQRLNLADGQSIQF
jgi:hypothetical protein